MILYRFNADGINAFINYRARLIEEPNLPPPKDLLQDPAYVEEIPGKVEVTARTFDSRLEAGIFLNDLLQNAGIDLPEKDKGLWTWLSLFFFDEICPLDGNGNRESQGQERLVPMLDNYQRFYRHLLLGPYLIVRAHRDDPTRANAILSGPLWKPGEIVAQVASRKEYVTNKGVIELATKLYYNPETQTFKRGAGSSVKGAARRLAAVLNQLDLTYYLYGMTADEILQLLPKEFDRFRN